MAKSASARFSRPKKQKPSDDEYLYLYAWKKVLTIKRPSGADDRKTFASDDELIAAFAARCEKAEAEGWREFGPPTTWRERIRGAKKPKKPKQRKQPKKKGKKASKRTD